MNYLESSGSTVKKKSPTSVTMIKDSMKPNLSAAEATAQLKVLCRKFAALTEKVKVVNGWDLGDGLKANAECPSRCLMGKSVLPGGDESARGGGA